MQINLSDIEKSVLNSFEELKNILTSENFFSGKYDAFIKNEYEVIFNPSQANNIYMNQDLIYDSVYSDLFNDPPIENRNPNLGYSLLTNNFIVDVQKIYSIYNNKLLILINTISSNNGWDTLENGYFIDIIHTDFCNFLHFLSYKNWADNHIESYFLLKQLKIYQLGGIPCGWKGIFPLGQPIVYLPLCEDRLVLITKLVFILSKMADMKSTPTSV